MPSLRHLSRPALAAAVQKLRQDKKELKKRVTLLRKHVLKQHLRVQKSFTALETRLQNSVPVQTWKSKVSKKSCQTVAAAESIQAYSLHATPGCADVFQSCGVDTVLLLDHLWLTDISTPVDDDAQSRLQQACLWLGVHGARLQRGFPFTSCSGFQVTASAPPQLFNPDMLGITVGSVVWGAPHGNPSGGHAQGHHAPRARDNSEFKSWAFWSMCHLVPEGTAITTFPEKYRPEFWPPPHGRVFQCMPVYFHRHASTVGGSAAAIAEGSEEYIAITCPGHVLPVVAEHVLTDERGRSSLAFGRFLAALHCHLRAWNEHIVELGSNVGSLCLEAVVAWQMDTFGACVI